MKGRFVLSENVEAAKVLSVPQGVQLRHAVLWALAPQGYEGEGFPVRRAFAGIPTHLLDPFIHMDQMGEVEYAPGEPKGTPWHPHRGFETFTYLLDGEFVHQDNHDGGGVIGEGGTQYMTAGDGILHIETPPEHLVMAGGLFHGVQLWINLPRAKKRIAPAYQDLQNTDTTIVTSPDGGAVVRVLAGQVDGHSGPGISHTPLTIAHVSVTAGARVVVPWPREFNAIAYTLSGKGVIGGAEVSTGITVVCGAGTAVEVTADQVQESRHTGLEVFLIGGVALREPVVAYGPFVMNSKAEVAQAYEDFQQGRLGTVPAGAIQPT